MDQSDQISFKAFLSHRYKSAEVNLYFFKAFSQVAEIQFEVDEGIFSTNVTRLEKMVRDADAFIGIYPFPASSGESPKLDDLKSQSKYFRLEIDIAIRSQKPAIIFYDKRYGNLLLPPAGIFAMPFDMNEITGDGRFPSFEKHVSLFTSFCNSVTRKREFDKVQINYEKNVAAIFISSDYIDKNGNSVLLSEKLKSVLETYNYSDLEVKTLPCVLDTKLSRLLERIDFAIVEHGGSAAISGLPAYLHGKFIPMIRIKSVADDRYKGDSLENFLFGGVEVGYKKDMIEWEEVDSLTDQIIQKLQIINSGIRRINTYHEAQQYFRGAMLRKEAVFVSYSGEDVEEAKDLIKVLKDNYQTVFDYRDGKSIVPGRPWVAEIFEKLSGSAIGISLLSDSYLNSGNCMHEAQQMMGMLDNKKMKLFPIKLYDKSLNLPAFFGSTQYIRKIDYASSNELVKEILKLT